MSDLSPPLPQGVGYGIVLGLGLLMAIAMNGITWIQAKYSKFSPNSASEFSAASRSLKTGLVVAGIVSSCTFLTLIILLNQILISNFRDVESDTATKRNGIIQHRYFWRILVSLSLF